VLLITIEFVDLTVSTLLEFLAPFPGWVEDSCDMYHSKYNIESVLEMYYQILLVVERIKLTLPTK